VQTLHKVSASDKAPHPRGRDTGRCRRKAPRPAAVAREASSRAAAPCTTPLAVPEPEVRVFRGILTSGTGTGAESSGRVVPVCRQSLAVPTLPWWSRCSRMAPGVEERHEVARRLSQWAGGGGTRLLTTFVRSEVSRSGWRGRERWNRAGILTARFLVAMSQWWRRVGSIAPRGSIAPVRCATMLFVVRTRRNGRFSGKGGPRLRALRASRIGHSLY
jgi:hypothetical protein